MWVNEVWQVSEMAHLQSQAAYSTTTKSLQFEWHHLERVAPNCEQLYSDLKDVLCTFCMQHLVVILLLLYVICFLSQCTWEAWEILTPPNCHWCQSNLQECYSGHSWCNWRGLLLWCCYWFTGSALARMTIERETIWRMRKVCNYSFTKLGVNHWRAI